MIGARYARGEVLFLLSLTHDQAVAMDAFPRDSCAGLSADKEKSKPSKSAEASLPVLVRWQDVQRAKREIVTQKELIARQQLLRAQHVVAGRLATSARTLLTARHAEQQLCERREGLAITQLVAAGFSEREVARLSSRDHMAVRRRLKATVDEILQRLGGEEPSDPGTLSHIDMCLTCGEHPRVRLMAVKRRVRGGWKETEPERQVSVCEDCLSDELKPRILRKVAVAA